MGKGFQTGAFEKQGPDNAYVRLHSYRITNSTHRMLSVHVNVRKCMEIALEINQSVGSGGYLLPRVVMEDLHFA